MPAFDPSILRSLDEQLALIVRAAPMMPLDDTGFDQATSKALEDWLKTAPAVSELAEAGLWLLAGDLDRSHTISQRIETTDGSYWHGIMHRREGDYFNAKYWMRRTGGHPVTEELKHRIPEYVDALSFVDYVEKAIAAQTRRASKRSSHDSSESDEQPYEIAQRVQWFEWQLLFAMR